VNELERMREACRRCGNDTGRRVGYRYRNGVVHIRHECDRCATLSLYCVPRSSSTASLPLAKDRLGEGEPCARCARHGTERHHWAPRSLFGTEADLWPVDWLSVECHRRWHVETGIAAAYRGRTVNNISATGWMPDATYEAVRVRLSVVRVLGEDGFALLLFQWLAGGHIPESELCERLEAHEQVRS
jgi:hypothetical protein